jgi:hypothetical protein
MNAAGVAKAAEGTRFIVHGPMYRNWPKLVLPMLESTIAAAKASGARILFPGSIYNFPPDGPLVLREDTPQRATTGKGVIRIVMERRLEEAQAQGRAQFDFARRRFLRSIYDWQQLVPAACQTGPPGAVDHLSGFAGHRAFLGLSAGCETMALLAERDASLAGFEVFHFKGHWFERGIEMAEAIRAVVADPHLPVRAMPW